MRAMVGVGIDPGTPLTVTLDDGLARCQWVTSPVDGLVAYHDEIWGSPVRDEAEMLAALADAMFAGGLSWASVFRKRATLRASFDGFEPATVAAYDDHDVRRLLADPGVVRNRLKIEQVIHDAGLVARGLSLVEFAWSCAPAPVVPVTHWSRALDTQPAAIALADRARSVGFRGIGPVVAHSLMNATGVIDGHVAGCFRARQRDFPPPHRVR